MINLNHPGIPIIYDVEEDYNYTCIIEQYIEGESLGALCSHRLLSEEEIYSFIFRIGSVIEYLHGLPESVVYLDLKPENVIISGGEAWLVDFASAVGKRKCSTLAAASASPGYTAPEQQANMAVGKTADVYALGRLLDYMVEHSSMEKSRRRKLKDLAGRCARDCPWKRISSADILMKMLRRQRKAETITTTHREKPAKEIGRNCRRIGVLGLKPGEGATTVAVALAHSLARLKGGKVLLVERSDHADLGSLYTEPDPNESMEGLYSLRNVICAVSETAVNTTASLPEADYIIYDLGSSVKRAAGTLTECDLCIAVAGAAPWRRQLYNFLDRPDYGGVAGLNWLLLVNHAEHEHLRDLKCSKIPMEAMPYVEDPTKPDIDTIGLFERAMR